MCTLSVIFLQVIVQIKRNTFNLRTSEITNYITDGGKHLKNNCSAVNKNDINKNDKYSSKTKSQQSIKNYCWTTEYQFYKEQI